MAPPIAIAVEPEETPRKPPPMALLLGAGVIAVAAVAAFALARGRGSVPSEQAAVKSALRFPAPKGLSQWHGVFDGETDPKYLNTVTLQISGDEIRGSYFYNHLKKPLPLKGHVVASSFVVDEFGEEKSEQPVAQFEGNFVEDGATGTWRKLDGSKTLSFSWVPLGVGERDDPTNMEDGPTIQAIRGRYLDVNLHQHLYAKTKQSVFGLSPEGTDLESFHEGRELRKISATMFGESGKGTTEVYFNAGEPDFVFIVATRYAGERGAPGEPTESRYYFRQGRLVWWTEGKERRAQPAGGFARVEAEILSVAHRLRDATETSGDRLDFDGTKFRPSLLPK